jgi:hypothetical protein
MKPALGALAIGLLCQAATADWAYVPPVERIAKSSLVFSGRVDTVRREESSGRHWHLAVVSVDHVLVGAYSADTIIVRTLDPTSLQCAPNEGLLGLKGRRLLWTFYRNVPPLEFGSTDGPLVDLGDAKAVRATTAEIDAGLAKPSKLTPREKQQVVVVLSALRRSP